MRDDDGTATESQRQQRSRSVDAETEQDVQESKKSKKSFDKKLTRISTIAHKAIQIAQMAENLPFIGDDIARINDKVQEITEKGVRVITDLIEPLEVIGIPADLREAGEQWMQLAKQAKPFTESVDPSALPTNGGHWTGNAFDRYIARAEPHEDAHIAFEGAAQSIDAWLNAMADAISSFWLSFSLALLDLVAGMAEAIADVVKGVAKVSSGAAECATLVGAIAGVPSVLWGLYNVFDGVWDGVHTVMDFEKSRKTLIDALEDASVRTANKLGEIARDFVATPAFANGAWPRHAAA